MPAPGAVRPPAFVKSERWDTHPCNMPHADSLTHVQVAHPLGVVEAGSKSLSGYRADTPVVRLGRLHRRCDAGTPVWRSGCSARRDPGLG